MALVALDPPFDSTKVAEVAMKPVLERCIILVPSIHRISEDADIYVAVSLVGVYDEVACLGLTEESLQYASSAPVPLFALFWFPRGNVDVALVSVS